MASYSHNHKQYTVRMILLGEAGAGKSSLYYRIKFKVTDYIWLDNYKGSCSGQFSCSGDIIIDKVREGVPDITPAFVLLAVVLLATVLQII